MRNNNGIVKGIGAILVAGVLAAGICCTGFASRGDDGKWFGNGNLSTWHWADKTDKAQEGNINGDNIGVGGSLIPDEVKGSGIRLVSAVVPVEEYSEYGIEAQADSGYSVTAIIEPEEATNKAVKYTAAFQNPSSAWANGKSVSDYVTVAQSSTGSLTATLTIKQAFGEPVLVTVTSDENPEITANFPVHYVKRMTGVTSSIAAATGLGADSIALGGKTIYSCVPTLGVGTVAGTFEITAKIFFAESYFWGPFKNNPYYTQAMNYSSYSGSKTPKMSGWDLTLSTSSGTAGEFSLRDSRDFFSFMGGGDLDGVCKRFNTALYQTAKNRMTSSSAAYGDVTFTVVNKYVDGNGKEHFRESKTSQSLIKAIDMSAISISVSSLSFPSGTAIYG